MIKDILKEVESLDHRIDALEHPTPEDEADKQLLGEDAAAPAGAESIEELKTRRDALLEQCHDGCRPGVPGPAPGAAPGG